VPTSPNWVDRVAGLLAPQWQLRRVRARLAANLLQRHYEGAAVGRRTAGWHRAGTDANTAVGPSLGKLRDAARDLVRNNPYAESALATIVNNAVSWGIVPAQKVPLFEAWANSTACDADGRHNLVGLQKLVMRTTAESGEVLVRRRWRRLEDGFPLPLQLQVLEPDFLDVSKEVASLSNGGKIVQGVEFDGIGRRVAYWLYASHPGSSFQAGGSLFGRSHRIPADEVLHIGRPGRPGQVRFPTWFAPVLLRFKDLAEFEDATLMKQKIAACLAVITSDVDGLPGPIGEEGAADRSGGLETDTLEPGMILNAPPGRNVSVVNPPTVREYADYTAAMLRSIAAGLGVAYEDMTGDFQDLSFSAARMSHLRHWPSVDDCRFGLLIPQFLQPVWGWAALAAAMMGRSMPATTEWTPPPAPMVDPDKEGLAVSRNVRAGIQTHFEAIRERGFVPEVFLAEYAAGLKKLDELRIVLDTDVRKVNQQGQAQSLDTAGSNKTEGQS
jgi:lambda family phage portal protein